MLFSLFLFAHGLVPVILAFVPAPAPGTPRTPYLPSWWRNNADAAWPAIRLGLPAKTVQTIGWVLWLSSAVLMAGAGAGLLGIPGLSAIWRILTAAGSALSLVMLALYWHPWLIIGVVINAFLLTGVATGWFTRWFTPH